MILTKMTRVVSKQIELGDGCALAISRNGKAALLGPLGEFRVADSFVRFRWSFRCIITLRRRLGNKRRRGRSDLRRLVVAAHTSKTFRQMSPSLIFIPAR